MEIKEDVFFGWDPKLVDRVAWYFRNKYNDYTDECDIYGDEVMSFEDYVKKNRSFLLKSFEEKNG